WGSRRPTLAVRRVTMPDQKPPFVFRAQSHAQRSMAMKMSFPILLVIVGCMGGAYASTVDESISLVRAQRSESNAAIAAHDAVRLRKLFDDDYHAILGSTGNIDSGGGAATRGYADEEFKDQTFVTYRR